VALKPAAVRSRRKEPELFLNRELSWLEFDARVLEEAADPGNRLLERLKFAIIAASNLDEFFMVRVAGLKRAVDEGETAPDPAGLTPARQLQLVSERAHALVDQIGSVVLDHILPGLAERGVKIVTLGALDDAQRSSLLRYFHVEVLPALTPLAIDTARPFPQLLSLSLNLAVLLAPTEEGGDPRLAVVQVPARLRRLVRPVGGVGSVYVLLEEIIRSELGALFPGQAVLESAVFRIVRDAEMELDDEGGPDYLQLIEQQLRERRRSDVVRLEVEAAVSEAMLTHLGQRLGISAEDVYRIRGPLELRALLPLLETPQLEDLRDPAWKPVLPAETREGAAVFELLDDRAVLLHHPYESFDPVVSFVQAAADDPGVLAIKQTLYRTSGESPIVQALARAAEQGKQVTVLVELMARFDEQANVRWARSLEQSGAHVIYGIRGYKTHAKICLVVRRGPNGIRRYVHLGTGNYNDKTARLYTDFGLMTSDAATGEDASAFFNALTGYSDPPHMKRLAMAPTQLRDRCLRLIDRERRRAEEGQAAEIRAKMNALVDEEMIRALYDASKAGVRIRLNVRGICCLRPGIKGVSENIEVVSVVDRFLEHSRVFHFRNAGDEEVWLSSADWMPRNLDRRIELLFPVPPDLRSKVMETLDAMFQDNTKSRRLMPDGSYKRRRPARGEEPFRAQQHLYRQAQQAAERARAAADVVFEPLATPDGRPPKPSPS
jgi:polyphosphate kinase